MRKHVCRTDRGFCKYFTVKRHTVTVHGDCFSKTKPVWPVYTAVLPVRVFRSLTAVSRVFSDRSISTVIHTTRCQSHTYGPARHRFIRNGGWTPVHTARLYSIITFTVVCIPPTYVEIKTKRRSEDVLFFSVKMFICGNHATPGRLQYVRYDPHAPPYSNVPLATGEAPRNNNAPGNSLPKPIDVSRPF